MQTDAERKQASGIGCARASELEGEQVLKVDSQEVKFRLLGRA